MHTKINIVKKLSGAYHNVWYEKSILQYWYSVCSSLEPELTQREYSHFFFTLDFTIAGHILSGGGCCFISSSALEEKRPEDEAWNCLRLIFHGFLIVSRCIGQQRGAERQKSTGKKGRKIWKKTLKVSNSFSRYRTYPKLHMMHICTMGYIRIIPD